MNKKNLILLIKTTRPYVVAWLVWWACLLEKCHIICMLQIFQIQPCCELPLFSFKHGTL